MFIKPLSIAYGSKEKIGDEIEFSPLTSVSSVVYTFQYECQIFQYFPEFRQENMTTRCIIFLITTPCPTDQMNGREVTSVNGSKFYQDAWLASFSSDDSSVTSYDREDRDSSPRIIMIQINHRVYFS